MASANEPTAEEILDLSQADPERALQMGSRFVEDDSPRRPRDLAVVYRAMSAAARLMGRFQEAMNWAETSRTIARAEGDDEQELLAVLMLASHMGVVGRAAEALGLIEASADLVTSPYLSARTEYQRGVAWMMMGEAPKAIAAFESALPAFREAEDQLMVRSALHGLGSLQVSVGELRSAERNLNEALAIAVARDEQPQISGIEQQLGRLASYRGDIITALALLMDSEAIYMRLTGSSAPQHVARCEVLMSAGLFREAHDLARRVVDANRSSGDPEHLAEALLVAASCALRAGETDAAHAGAREAMVTFESHGRPTHALAARRIEMEARHIVEGASPDLLESVLEVALELEARKLLSAAASARLLAGRVAIDLGDVDEAKRSLRAVSAMTRGPVESRIQARLAKARVRLLEDDRRGADAAARSGLRLVDDYQAALGATDLRMGLERHGADLGEIGLDLALGSGVPRRILTWMERTRARALRHRPVTPDDDEDIGDALAHLRQVEAKLRRPENEGDRDLLRLQARLQEEIRASDRLKHPRERSDSGFGVDVLLDELGDATLLEMAIHDGRLVAIEAYRGRARRVDVGRADRLLAELAPLRFAMRRSALLGRPFHHDRLADMDRRLFGGCRLEGDELLVVPPPALMALPWAAFPTMRGNRLTVSPSAEMWWRARAAARHGSGVVVVGGPDLPQAAAEVVSVGSQHENPTLLLPGVSVEETGDALDGARLAHVVCHATFRVENPMFSSLRLGDGDLNVYDIERFNETPSIVVLSACDSGYTDTHPGDELAGLTSALLTMGAQTVVASVGLVPDSKHTETLMVRFHRGLASGQSPAEALAVAQSEGFDDPESFVSAASFISIGS